MQEDPEYAEFVDERFKMMPTYTESVLHAAVGISGEAGEIIDAVKKTWAYGKPLDFENLVEEIGDLLFYVQALCNLLHVTVDSVVGDNVVKLNKRYPTGYSDADAIARADKTN